MLVIFLSLSLARKQIVTIKNSKFIRVVQEGDVCTQEGGTITSQINFNTACAASKKFYIRGTTFNVPNRHGWGNCIWCTGLDFQVFIYDNTFTSNGGDRGGAIDTRGIKIEIRDNVFTNCRCAKSGGGSIFIDGDSMTQVANVTISNNRFTQSYASIGGAINTNSRNMMFTIFNNVFTNCYTNNNGNGGAIRMTNSVQSVTIEDCQFSNCYTGGSGSGGAICIDVPAGGIDVTTEYRILGCSFNDIGGQRSIIAVPVSRSSNIVLEITKTETRNVTISNSKSTSAYLLDIGFMRTTISYMNVLSTIGSQWFTFHK